ncbi:MAG TPA: hydrogenase maturation protease [Solirubrobacteraceae bacterium]
MIGVGNALRGDDAAGLEVVRLLSARAAAAGVVVREQEGEALGLLEQWDGADVAILVDAIHSGAPAGTVHRVDASRRPIPARLGSSSSTHAIGVAEAVELARAMGRLPARVILVGLEGTRFDTGAALSAEVRAAVGEMAEAVLREALRQARSLAAATAACP